MDYPASYDLEDFVAIIEGRGGGSPDRTCGSSSEASIPMQIEQPSFISIIKNRIIKNFIINLRRYASPPGVRPHSRLN